MMDDVAAGKPPGTGDEAQPERTEGDDALEFFKRTNN